MFYYDTEEMKACTNHLNSILERGITEETLDEFSQLALNLNWQGSSAEIFKSDVLNTISLLRQQLWILKDLANHPLISAQLMEKIDTQESERIKNLF